MSKTLIIECEIPCLSEIDKLVMCASFVLNTRIAECHVRPLIKLVVIPVAAVTKNGTSLIIKNDLPVPALPYMIFHFDSSMFSVIESNVFFCK